MDLTHSHEMRSEAEMPMTAAGPPADPRRLCGLHCYRTVAPGF